MFRIKILMDEDFVKGRRDYLSIGLKFALWFLVTIFFTVGVLALLYFSNSSFVQQFIVALMAGFLSAETLAWIALRPTLRERLVEVWENYLKPIRDSADKPFQFNGFLADYYQKELTKQTDLLSKYGKYGPFHLYPKILLKNKLVERFIRNGRNFEEKLDQLVAIAKTRGVELNLHVAFRHWGFKPIFENFDTTLTAEGIQNQIDCLKTLERTDREVVAELKKYHGKVVTIGDGISSIVDSFAGKNGIFKSKPTSG
jgi:hypothetical protein